MRNLTFFAGVAAAAVAIEGFGHYEDELVKAKGQWRNPAW